MSRPEQTSTRAAAAQRTAVGARGERLEIRDEAVAPGPEGRQTRRHAAEPPHEANVFLDEVAVIVTDFLEHHGFALLAPVVARFRMAENGSSGVKVVVGLEDPSDADAAKAALVERFPDRLSEVIVS